MQELSAVHIGVPRCFFFGLFSISASSRTLHNCSQTCSGVAALASFLCQASAAVRRHSSAFSRTLEIGDNRRRRSRGPGSLDGWSANSTIQSDIAKFISAFILFPTNVLNPHGMKMLQQALCFIVHRFQIGILNSILPVHLLDKQFTITMDMHLLQSFLVCPFQDAH